MEPPTVPGKNLQIRFEKTRELKWSCSRTISRVLSTIFHWFKFNVFGSTSLISDVKAKQSKAKKLDRPARGWQYFINPLHPNINICNLHTFLVIFPMVLTRRIFLTMTTISYILTTFCIWSKGDPVRRKKKASHYWGSKGQNFSL